MKRIILALSALAGLCAITTAAAAPAKPEVKLWRIDCGTLQAAPVQMFSDTGGYGAEAPMKALTVSCYLIKHGDTYMLWDAGLPGDLVGHPQPAAPLAQSLKKRIVDYLADIGVKPDEIALIGVSHDHFDHLSQAIDFPKAKLLIGADDLAALKAIPPAPRLQPQRLAPWLKGERSVEAIPLDKDVFDDGSVVILNMPGHTAGHKALLVRLAKTGSVLLSGDLYHFALQRQNKFVPVFNMSRAETLASFDRFKQIAKNEHAKVIIGHEPDDIAKLPLFPNAAD